MEDWRYIFHIVSHWIPIYCRQIWRNGGFSVQFI